MTDVLKHADQFQPADEPDQDPLADCSGMSLDEIDEQTLTALYEEFADEDRALTNQGLAEYAAAISPPTHRVTVTR
jgi:hypothetical protein